MDFGHRYASSGAWFKPSSFREAARQPQKNRDQHRGVPRHHDTKYYTGSKAFAHQQADTASTERLGADKEFSQIPSVGKYEKAPGLRGRGRLGNSREIVPKSEMDEEETEHVHRGYRCYTRCT